jgi:decaprenyl-phosphate phosphoribosyltransferase
MTIIKLLRINQWIKNLLIFSPLLFSLKLLNSSDMIITFYTFLAFSFLSSFIYVQNDIIDLESDKLHSTKKYRPIASGQISKRTAHFVSILSLMISVLFSIIINHSSLYLILIAYLVLNILYNFYLKRISIIDCISISIGFELRILAGCVVIDVIASDFILVVTFFLALLLAFLKRKGELQALPIHSTKHRKVLNDYSVNLLDKYIFATATITIIGYLFYSIDNRVTTIIGNDYLKYSMVFVVYGIFRFIQLGDSNVYEKEGDPTTLLYKDRALQLSILSWTIYVTLCLYAF